MHWNEWSWSNWTLMTIVMVIFWTLVIRAIVAAARSPQRADTHRTPEQILAERFATGEIDRDDYDQRFAALQSTRTAHSDGALQEHGAKSWP